MGKLNGTQTQPDRVPSCSRSMSDAPITCTFLLMLDGEAMRLTITSQLDVPVIVRFRLEPCARTSSAATVVATWSNDEWHVFEGAECSDPRCLLALALGQGCLLRGPCPHDWPLIEDFFGLLTRAKTLHRR